MDLLPIESETVLVLAPYGRDATLACAVLQDARIDARICPSMDELCAQLDSAGAAIITTEALSSESRAQLLDVLDEQQPWSDFPILVFGSQDRPQSGEMLRALGNATLLERPVGVRALVSAVEGALRARRRQYAARRAIRDRDHFLAMLGHELRNPLAAISLAVGGLERGSADVARRERHVGVVKRQSEHLGRLVDDLLDVARVTSGRIELALRDLDLVAVVGRCVATFEAQAVKNGLALSLNAPDTPVYVSGDAIRLEQILNNLLANAVKYTPEGGRIEVVVEPGEHIVAVRVRDNGVGIPADTLPFVFDLFAQAPGTLDRSRGGLGIGLTLVRSLTNLHGGTVEAHSAGAGTGTEIVLRLPRNDAPSSAELIAPHAALSGDRKRVLVVDDSDDVRESLKEVLEDLGHDVVTAADGAGGLARLLEFLPAVAIIDIGLPGIDGYEIARKARRALGQRVRLVALTGYGQPEDKRRAVEAGFDEHFTKPVDVSVLEGLFAPVT